MKTWIGAILITIGFTIWGNGDEPLATIIALLIGKLSLIALGVIVLVSDKENEI